MKEKPILFSLNMVNAILSGRKTQTRRMVKPQPPKDENAFGWAGVQGMGYVPVLNDGREILCPFGTVGDRLWVRENFQLWYGGMTDCGEEWDIYEGELNPAWETDENRLHPKDRGLQWRYQASGDAGDKWRPSIHMPRWASRITLEITGVKAERLNAITEADARAEGVQTHAEYYGIPEEKDGLYGDTPFYRYDGACCAAHNARASFESLWNSIHGAGAWKENPFVWAITFKRIDTPSPQRVPGTSEKEGKER